MEKTIQKHGTEKDSSVLMRQWKIFDKLTDEIHDEIQNLSEQIPYNNLTYFFKIKNESKNVIGFKSPSSF